MKYAKRSIRYNIYQAEQVCKLQVIHKNTDLHKYPQSSDNNQWRTLFYRQLYAVGEM